MARNSRISSRDALTHASVGQRRDRCRGRAASPASHRGAQIRTGDLSDPNGARYQAAPHPETAHRLASPGAIRPDFRGYVAFSENEEDRMNVVTLIGNLATDVDTREVGDKQVADQHHNVHPI